MVEKFILYLLKLSDRARKLYLRDNKPLLDFLKQNRDVCEGNDDPAGVKKF